MNAGFGDRARWTAVALACAGAAVAWILALEAYMAASWNAEFLRALC